VVVVWAFALPRIPSPGSAEPSGYAVFVVAVVVQWAALSLAVAGRLWWAGRGLATVARRRMRTLSLGSGLMATVVLFAGVAGPRQHPAVDFGLELASLAGALVFLVGFAPPAMLRTTWRRREEPTLRQAQLQLMTSTTAQGVASPLLEPIAGMLGGSGALLADPAGRVLAAYGLEPGEAADTAAGVAAAAASEPWLRGGVLAVPLRAGWLAVHASPYAPVFGGGEIALVQRLGLFIDMALEQTRSVETDRAAREAVERANSEMESLLFTVSHDLKSPLLTVLGYVDLLRAEGVVVGDHARHCVDRMELSALYMQQLINDLLELSRIGRAEAGAEAVDLASLVRDIADELRARRPTAYVGVGLLPVVTMSPVRARQLLTNLIDNAVEHSGREDVAIEVGAQARPDGAARLWVADDGRGVPPEHRERVFGVFERFDDRGAGEGGTGIGLAVCRKIVESVGGSVRLADAQRGTRVEIVLPASVVRWQTASVGALR
jgi:signal transduction histidine kinase